MAGCTDKIILENAQLSLNSAIDTYGIDFDISGNIVLHVTNIDRYADNQILLRNVSGAGAFVVLMDDVSDDLLFVHVAYVSDGNLYLRRVRNTNYSSIMKDEVGAMLDSLRVYNPRSRQYAESITLLIFIVANVFSTDSFNATHCDNESNEAFVFGYGWRFGICDAFYNYL